MSLGTLRDDKLLELLREHGTLTVAQVGREFGVSLPTARRMCAQLAHDGRVLRTHGGIRRLPEVRAEYSFEAVKNEHLEEKIRIARHASGLVRDGETLFMEAGTTVRQFAIALAERMRKGELGKVVVFTNSLINLDILHPRCEVILVGGRYRENRRDFCGYICEKAIRGLHFDVCFVGADGISVREGIMASDIETVSIDELLVSRSDRTVILAHAAKFSRHSLISYAAMSDVSLIVTDSALPPAVAAECEAEEISLVRV